MLLHYLPLLISKEIYLLSSRCWIPIVLIDFEPNRELRIDSKFNCSISFVVVNTICVV